MLRLLIFILIVLTWVAPVSSSPVEYEPEKLFHIADDWINDKDPNAVLIFVAYLEGNREGRFQSATFVFFSEELAHKSEYNSYQVMLRQGRLFSVGQLKMPIPRTPIPHHHPGAAIRVAKDWSLGAWWDCQTGEVELKAVLRPPRKEDDFYSSVEWIWEVTGWGQAEDCNVYLKAPNLKRLRTVINPAPSVEPPDEKEGSGAKEETIKREKN
jgi:hypothetical protein